MEYSRFTQLEPIYYFCEIDYVFKNEQWKDVPDYETLYQASDLGRLKSLSKIQLNHGKYPWTTKDRILKPTDNGKKCLMVAIYKNKKVSYKTVHQLVAISFLNHSPCGHKLVVDHINNNSLDNRKINLQIITQRLNLSKDKKNGSSKYTGVSWDKVNKKWAAGAYYKGTHKQLGRFINETDARDAYINFVNSL